MSRRRKPAAVAAKIIAARDERAVLRRRTGSPWNAANRALVTANFVFLFSQDEADIALTLGAFKSLICDGDK
jgi:hypothetical protein